MTGRLHLAALEHLIRDARNKREGLIAAEGLNRLVTEIDRLHTLIRRAAETRCTDMEGFCHWCRNIPEHMGHMPECPWPELEAEARRQLRMRHVESGPRHAAPRHLNKHTHP